jgi:MFS family permease
VGMAVAGMLLIAATYGMARFGVGLFAPYLMAQRPALAGVLGWAAGAQFTAYCVAALVAARVVDRHARAGLLIAGVTAASGCLGVALAADPVTFVVAVVVGGMGGAFASASLVPVIDAVVAPSATSRAQAVANTGTAVGVIGSGLLSLTTNRVTPAWALMALFCAATAVAAWFPVRARTSWPLPGARNAATPRASASASNAWSPLAIPAAAAVLLGCGSSLIWTFGPSLVTKSGSVPYELVGWLWVALGLGGLLGTLTSSLVDRVGLRGGWCVCAGTLAAASAGIALAVTTGGAWVAYLALAVFGAGYMGLSGVLILWARNAWPGRAGGATSLLFIALSVGQACGSLAFGTAQSVLSPVVLAGLAAGACAGGGLVALIGRPRPGRQLPDGAAARSLG